MELTLQKKFQENPNCYSFIFQPDQEITWQAGQFLKYEIEDENPDNRGNSRYFTIASAPWEKNIQLTTKIETQSSSFKKKLLNFKEGEKITVKGPMGSFIIEKPYQEFVFLAGGIGITPFRSILLDLDRNELPLNVTLIYANRDENFLFTDIFDSLQKKYPLFNVYYLISPQRIDNEIIQNKVPLLEKSVFYVSGPKPFVTGMENLAAELKVDKANIKTDYFPGYEDI